MWRFLRHLLTAKNTGGHGIHSPYVFNFVKNVVYEKNPYYVYSEIENVRKQMLSDRNSLFFNDFGTGKNRIIKVSEVAAKSVKKKKYAQLIYRVVNFIKPDVVLELGTSLGLTTCYIAAVSEKTKCITIEGCTSIAEIARHNFEKLKRQNINLITGNIDVVLPDVIRSVTQLDLIFIDANHTSEALINYFEQCMGKITPESIMIIDDIHYSKEMEKGWSYIQNKDEVKVTLDLFEIGIVFFKTDINTGNFKLMF
jgi:predicted O-methyltransferase YrrM